MKNVSELRQSYSESTNAEERKELATKEIAHWFEYLQIREKALPEHYRMNNKTLSLLEEVFERESERRNKMLRSDRVIDFHYTFAKVKKFDIAIHQRNMIQMIHPFHGYLCHVEDKLFKFDEMINIYRQQLVSSYERSLGQTLLAGKAFR